MTLPEEIRKRLAGLSSSYQDRYPTSVVGESYYKENILAIVDYLAPEDGCDEDYHTAALYYEDDNESDPNAVRVEIDDRVVGYLPKSTARSYRKRMRELGAPENPIGICAASIKGGFATRNGETADFGVRLDFYVTKFTLVPVKIKDESPQQPAQTQSPPEPESGALPAADDEHPPPVKKSNRKGMWVVLTAVISLCAVCCCLAVLLQPAAN